jgi:hypothetical protein
MKSLLVIGLTGLAGLAAASAATGCGSRPPSFIGGAVDVEGNDGAPAPEGDGGESLAPPPGVGSAQGLFSSDGGTATGLSLGDAGCATATAEAKRQPAYLLFVLDGSGSMSQQNKWTAVVPALEDIFGRMETAADTGVAAGLVVFSDTNDSTMGSGPYPGSADVPIAFVSAAQQMSLDSRLSGMPMNSTPTESALTGGYGELEAFQAQAPVQSGGKKVLVLITDGVPTDGCMSTPGVSDYSTNPCVQLAGQKLAEVGPKGPIETFVIGVGNFAGGGGFFGTSGIDPSFLGNLAQAGGTGPAKCNPNETKTTSDLCYFEIDPSMSTTAAQLQMQFETALDAIRGQVLSCTFPIQSSGLGQVDPTRVNVEVNGKTILQDPTDGWTYDDPMKPTDIVLHGSACATAMGTITARVSIVLGCVTQVPK